MLNKIIKLDIGLYFPTRSCYFLHLNTKYNWTNVEKFVYTSVVFPFEEASDCSTVHSGLVQGLSSENARVLSLHPREIFRGAAQLLRRIVACIRCGKTRLNKKYFFILFIYRI